ncbi:MAG: helicase-associated domain-containing protein [Actinomycetota bacterium]|nr:helicase-associated domain-containing protein [Actinomycetota bacterium]
MNALRSLSDPDDRQVRLTEREALTNLRIVLELCATGIAKCSDKTSRPSAATIRTIDEHLVHGDFYSDEPIAAFAWPLLVQAGGLHKLDGTRLQTTPKGRAALGKPPAETIRLLWQRWLTHAVIDEFSRIEEIKGQRIRNVLTAAKPRRQLVATALATCPPGEWIDVDTLFTTMRRGNMSPTIARTDMALWKLYLVDPQYGSLGYDGFHDWELLEGRYTLAVLFEYAGTLGLIDLDYVDPSGARVDFHGNWGGDDLDTLSRYDGLQAIRLTALGAYVLGLTSGYQPTSADTTDAWPLKVLPNLDIVATGDITAADRLILSAYAKQTADRVWTVSAASLLSAVDTSRNLTELTTFLSERTEHDLPGALSTLIVDIHRRAEQLTDLGHARVIECADPATAALITHDRSLRQLCHPIGDRHLAVPLDQELKFRKALLKIGYAVPGQPAT